MGRSFSRWLLLGALVGAACVLNVVSLHAQEPVPPVEGPVEGDPAAPPPEGDPVPPPAEGEAVPAEEGAAPEESAAPAQELDKWNDEHSILRLTSPSIAWLKLALLAGLFLIWVKSADWVNRDSQIYDIGYGTWNPVIFFPFAVGMLLALPLLFPMPFLVSSILLTLIYLVTFFTYVVVRNKGLQHHERVFTPEWFRYEIATGANKLGLKVSAERKADYEKGAPVDLMAMGSPDERENQANLITARQSPGYLLVKDLVADMVDRRSDRMILDYNSQQVAMQHRIDGVWHNGDARDRESGDVMLAVMKQLANLNIAERAKKQVGQFAAKYKNHSYLCPIESQGVKTGERVSLAVKGGEQREFKTFVSLGMRDKLREQWAEIMERDTGLLIISALPEGGLTTLTDVSLMETDRLMRDFFSVEDVQNREREIENVEVETYDSKKGEKPLTVLPKLVRRYPNVYVVRDHIDTEAAKILFNEIKDDRLVITTIQAREAAEAMLRMLQNQVPHRDFAAVLTAVINTRLIRKLCETCRVGYTPAADMLQKLGIPAGKVETFFRTPKPEEMDKPCPDCGGIGYKGRTALFELLVVNDQIREVLLKQPKLEPLRKAARAAGMRTLQEEGILLVAKGVTSVQELGRVLKQ
jgi:type II secretory ATPase GspE/PulE/Tfp pilus assembly ATPase PilB-like protein